MNQLLFVIQYALPLFVLSFTFARIAVAFRSTDEATDNNSKGNTHTKAKSKVFPVSSHILNFLGSQNVGTYGALFHVLLATVPPISHVWTIRTVSTTRPTDFEIHLSGYLLDCNEFDCLQSHYLLHGKWTVEARLRCKNYFQFPYWISIHFPMAAVYRIQKRGLRILPTLSRKNENYGNLYADGKKSARSIQYRFPIFCSISVLGFTFHSASETLSPLISKEKRRKTREAIWI